MTQSIFDILAWRAEEIPRIRSLLGMRKFWSTRLYGKIRDEYEAATGDKKPADTDEAFAVIDELPSLRRWAWLDRHVQDQLWRDVGDMVDDRLDDIDVCLEAKDDDLGQLLLEDDMQFPGYYEDIDFHRQIGGIWRGSRGAAIYAMGARVIHIGKNDDFGLHNAFADDIEIAAPENILDLACGFGKTTFSLKKRFPDAHVEGIDLAAPCLRLGRRMATEMGLNIDWRQGDIEHLPYDDDQFDLLTTTMTIHELPMDAIARSLAEAHRVLKPDGLLVTLENPLVGEPLRDALTHYHSQIIEEPFHYDFRRADLAKMLEDEGFRAITVKDWFPFGGMPGVKSDTHNWVTPWRWLEARKD